MILLKQSQYEEIVTHSLKEVPEEACGLLGGTVKGDIKTVEKVYILTNTDHSPEHFSMDPKEQFGAIKDMRSRGLILLGNFHSHPASPSRPSEEDKRLAFDPEASYLILSLMDRKAPVFKAFHIRGAKVMEEEVKLI